MNIFQVRSCFAVAALVAFVGHVEAITVTEYLVSRASGTTSHIVSGPDGNLWFADDDLSNGTFLGRITRSGDVTLYPPPPGDKRFISSIAAGPDGNLWYAEDYERAAGSDWKIAKIAPSGTLLAEYSITAACYGIVAGPDGNLWFTESRIGPLSDAIGRITPAGLISEFNLPGTDNGPERIVTGPDGNLWFELSYKDGTLGRITLSGFVSEFAVPSSTRAVYGLTPGPDGNVWFVETGYGPTQIGNISPAGSVSELVLSKLIFARGITTGSDGNLWVYDQNGLIDQVSPSGAEIQTTAALEGVVEIANITTGPDGNLWLTESDAIATFAPDSIFLNGFEVSRLVR